MITKGYTADYPYTAEIGVMLEKWVWGKDKKAVPVYYVGDGADFERVHIGEMRPIRWWRQTVTRAQGPSAEYAMIHFSVQHVVRPEKRMGDFCGANHHLALEVEDGVIVEAAVMRR